MTFTFAFDAVQREVGLSRRGAFDIDKSHHQKTTGFIGFGTGIGSQKPKEVGKRFAHGYQAAPLVINEGYIKFFVNNFQMSSMRPNRTPGSIARRKMFSVKNDAV